MTKPCILFVDDEPNILQGLKRFTRLKRSEWNMLFAAGGADALGLMRAQQVDILVTDMRMPGLDGADLLQHVSEEMPGVIRIILSGEADVEQTYRTVGRSHRFMAKPCDPTLLVSTIEQILARRDHAGQETSLRMNSFFDRLTSRPGVIGELRRELDHKEASTPAVTSIIMREPGLAARILQLVNSAYFGRSTETFNIGRAVEILGLERISALLERGRLGKATFGEVLVGTTSGKNSRPEQLAKCALDFVRAGDGTSDEQELAFALGLFRNLGSIPGETAQSTHSAGCLADRSAVFATALLGLPDILTNRLSDMAAIRPDDLSKENCAELICKTVLQKAEEAA